jgi:hypothetical protein
LNKGSFPHPLMKEVMMESHTLFHFHKKNQNMSSQNSKQRSLYMLHHQYNLHDTGNSQ